MALDRLWHIASYGLSDAGLVRDKNEDAWARELSCHIYVLADGIGGRQAGEVAASHAVHRMCELLSEERETKLDYEQITELLKKSIQQVNDEIYDLGRQNEFLKGMGTTLCLLLIHHDIAYIAHMGDSRIYLIRANSIKRLTQDHRPAHIAPNMCSHIITRALGIQEIASPTIDCYPLHMQDFFLLCSDGLTNSLSDNDITAIILSERYDLKRCCNRLIDQAKHAGGKDNITTLLISIEHTV